MRGIYCLVFQNRAVTLGIGALGEVAFREGWHLYVGSAQGPGGLGARVGRHVHLAADKDRRPRWHVDRLLLSGAFVLRGAVCAATDDDLECGLAAAIGGEAVEGFGCSDCRCFSHLFYRPDEPFTEVADAFTAIRLDPRIRKTNMGGCHLNV
ncbi:DUF123 domain-containing protein [Methanofollis formosanus]|uniref:DUF123 domain-containing protein n=1 Tax=Methanofollis formosanus TaxID=299308 RepID=A0A8G1A271_9EURY|nr:DUF123 domain-containing protein [Methanofollis formosanus]QYZ79343.1 DUF123 domain-containing protein [Methanofollis formosanus]